jgi:hypothetical protein
MDGRSPEAGDQAGKLGVVEDLVIELGGARHLLDIVGRIPRQQLLAHRGEQARLEHGVHVEGKGAGEIAEALGVSRMSVWRALNGRAV